MGRKPRNQRPDLNGLLVIDKPLGMTSAAVCRLVRARTGGAKVGHAGTLDPLATGVLIVCLGAATKAVPKLMAGEKKYIAEVDLSAFSTTDDMEGETTALAVKRTPTREDVEAASKQFIGNILQRPPAYSALKIDGKAAYKRARAGETLELEPRPVVIHNITVIAYEWPIATLDVRCGKGVYIRSLARNLGESLGTGGRLKNLRRTLVDPYGIDDAIELDKVSDPFDQSLLRPPPQ